MGNSPEFSVLTQHIQAEPVISTQLTKKELNRRGREGGNNRNSGFYKHIRRATEDGSEKITKIKKGRVREEKPPRKETPEWNCGQKSLNG